MKLEDFSSGSHEGGDVAVFLGLGHHPVHVLPHTVEGGEIALHILLGLPPAHADVLGQGEIGDTIDDPEIHRLGPAAHLMAHLLRRDPKDLGGGGGVDVRPAEEGLLHGLVIGDVGQQPQLDLGVVGVHQHMARGRYEHIPQLGAQLGAHRDVLEIGLRGGQPPRGGDRVLERGVDAPVRADDLGQPVHIGGLQLGVLAVAKNGVDDGVVALELFQHLGIGGVSRFGLLHRRQAQLVKEDVTKLLGGIDVEGLPRLLIDALLDGLDRYNNIYMLILTKY